MIQLNPPKPFPPRDTQTNSSQTHSQTNSSSANRQSSSFAAVPSPRLVSQEQSLNPQSLNHLTHLNQAVERADRGRVVVFIDGASLFYAAMQMEIEVDYMRLLGQLTRGGRLIHSHFYTGVDPSNEKQKGFLYWMQCNGYRVITKDLSQSTTGSKKVSLNVEITVDMMRLAPYCDTMILVSGDGDLTCALDFVTYQGVQTEVVGLRSMISESLINVADYYTDLATIRQDIQKRVVA
jgi:uncharacterized LabA/DUF88 family protein